MNKLVIREITDEAENVENSKKKIDKKMMRSALIKKAKELGLFLYDKEVAFENVNEGELHACSTTPNISGTLSRSIKYEGSTDSLAMSKSQKKEKDDQAPKKSVYFQGHILMDQMEKLTTKEKEFLEKERFTKQQLLLLNFYLSKRVKRLVVEKHKLIKQVKELMLDKAKIAQQVEMLKSSFHPNQHTLPLLLELFPLVNPVTKDETERPDTICNNKVGNEPQPKLDLELHLGMSYQLPKRRHFVMRPSLRMKKRRRPIKKNPILNSA